MSGILEHIESKMDALLNRMDGLEKKMEVILSEEELISTLEVAELTGVHINTVRKLCEEGYYKTAKKHGNQWRVQKSEVLNQK